ncbi:hypothetical protein [Streptomyces sp. NPDC006012]|uniref:hypothetical protein n=1 Tax=Streptomyces sp. NPDC006012 TaxID=3364739 RepID=UPI0036794CD7
MAANRTESGEAGGERPAPEEREAPAARQPRSTASVSGGVIGAAPEAAGAAPEPEAGADGESGGAAETEAEAEPEMAEEVASALRGSGAANPPESHAGGAESEAERGSDPAGTAKGETEEPSPEAEVPETVMATATPARAAAPAASGLARLSWLRSRRTSTATATATATAADGGSGDGDPGTRAAAAPGNLNRISPPMVAAAAIGGVILLAAPFVISANSGDDSKDKKNHNTAAGYAGPHSSPSGYVPSAQPDAGKSSGTKASATPNPPAPKAGSVADAAGQGVSADKPSPDGAHKSPGTSGSGSKAAGQPAAGAESKPKASQVFSAYAGPHCSGSGASYSEHGSSSVSEDEWTTAMGGYASNGCTGRFRSVPMSGEGKDAGNYATWAFNTGGRVTSGTCSVSVHIPDSSDIRHVGGDPSYYTVHSGGSASGTQLASFTIDQTSQPGQWVAAPSVKISDGRLAVVLHDRGNDWNSHGATDAHHAADAVYVKCT